MTDQRVIGRFAPTPSGPLHFGSLVTAVASYCHARSQQGQWLLRIEDVDTPRNVEGSAEDIISTLEAFGFEWDDSVEHQSDYLNHYLAVLKDLLDKGLCFACECSRRSLREAGAQTGSLGLIYPGFCREKHLDPKSCSVRVNTNSSGLIHYVDGVYGKVEFDIEKQLGDFVMRRADSVFAYHLAVVVDDQRQGINQIVRGADLLEATCLHIFLQRLLSYQTPDYLHIPLIRNAAGDKLSKQTGAEGIGLNQKSTLLIKALRELGQVVETSMEKMPVKDILTLAISNWDHRKISVTNRNIY